MRTQSVMPLEKRPTDCKEGGEKSGKQLRDHCGNLGHAAILLGSEEASLALRLKKKRMVLRLSRIEATKVEKGQAVQG